jgi:KAP family P-loop domain
LRIIIVYLFFHLFEFIPQIPALKILDDDTDFEPILNFEEYSECIVDMIRGSNPKFSIGVYGEWGTGKTPLMKLVQQKLKKFLRKEVFTWAQNAIQKKELGFTFNYLSPVLSRVYLQ